MACEPDMAHRARLSSPRNWRGTLHIAAGKHLGETHCMGAPEELQEEAGIVGAWLVLQEEAVVLSFFLHTCWGSLAHGLGCPYGKELWCCWGSSAAAPTGLAANYLGHRSDAGALRAPWEEAWHQGLFLQLQPLTCDTGLLAGVLDWLE